MKEYKILSTLMKVNAAFSVVSFLLVLKMNLNRVCMLLTMLLSLKFSAMCLQISIA